MNKHKGFTLIELLAVIVIIVILFFIALPIFNNVITRAKYGAFGSSKKSIERAAELYYASNADKIIWDNNIGYIEIGTLKTKSYLKKDVVNLLNNMSISDDTKVLLYKKGKSIEYSLQLYNDEFFTWYQGQMIKGSKKDNNNLPVNIGDKKTIELDTLMDRGLTDELRLPLDLDSRCVGYVEIEKTSNNDYNYDAYVDCLTEASTFASHYVSYGGKYLDEFNEVIQTSDGGYVAVGKSNSEVITKYGTGNNGKDDAIIVKFASDGIVEWSFNFGGSGNDLFNSVVETSGGYIAVGSTASSDIDLDGLYKGGSTDALIVKYDKNGKVVYKRSYGSSGTQGSEVFYKTIFDGSNFIIVGSISAYVKDGDLTGVTGIGGKGNGIILKLNSNMEILERGFFTGNQASPISSVILTSDMHYMAVGGSTSYTLDMQDIAKSADYNDYDAFIAKFDTNLNLVNKAAFGGAMHTEIFDDLVEVSDGYIFIGHGISSELDMEGLSKANNGFSDAIIVKYDKELKNILWKKSFGGSNDDKHNSIVKINENEVLLVGSSKSNDMDMQGIAISSHGYSNSIINKYNVQNGNLISRKIFGGDNSDTFNSIVKTNDNLYIIAGATFSNTKNLKKFNKGHQDAILVGYDQTLNLTKIFKEPVVLIELLKQIISNYGTTINLKYENIYTSNDPTKDLMGWCSNTVPYTEGNTSNYYYGTCLTSFNPDDSKILTEIEVNSGLRMYLGEYEYKLTNKASNNYNWHMIKVHNSGSTGSVELSNLKIKFLDGYVGHITDAVAKGYIEPMVVVHSTVGVSRPAGLYPTVIDIINKNGRTGVATYPALRIHIKPKKSEFIGLFLTSSKDSVNNDGLTVIELRNFDISVTPTS